MPERRTPSVSEQLDTLTGGCVDVVRREELRARLDRSITSRQPLIVKVGFDPTAPDLHLGHTVLIRKMKDFQPFLQQHCFVSRRSSHAISQNLDGQA